MVDLSDLRAQLGAAYHRFDDDAQSRHIEWLRAVQGPTDLVFHVERRGHGSWRVTVCTWDWLGTLSIIAGLFAASRLDIRHADIFTVRLPSAQDRAPFSRRRMPFPTRQRSSALAHPPRKILDIFEVQAPEDVPAEVWQRLRDDLEALVRLLAAGQLEAAREEVVRRVSDAAREAGEPVAQLFPVAIEIDNETSPSFTQLTIRSTDTLGFLFAFTNALTELNVNIEQAEVRTFDGEVHDTFWLTDAAGQKLTSERRLRELRVAAALIKHFTHLLPRSPNPSQALHQFHALTSAMLSRPDWLDELRNLESPSVLQTLAQMMGVSQFLWEDFLRMQHENLFPVLVDVPALEARRSKDQLREGLTRELAGLRDQGERIAALNRFKDREMFRIDLRHITGRISFREFSEELSDLAEVVVESAAELALRSLEPRFGAPALRSGQPCAWTICALGKFGGRELGFASDIELIVVYEDEGTTAGPESIENSRFFAEFVRTFLNVLSARREGIFEIDLRLRPYGNAGPLATTLKGFRDYYAEHGDARQFERLALVKLRPVAGDLELGARIVQARDAFVYAPSPLDLENIRHLRQRQATELVPPGAVNAKYSPGGLTDIEYYVQALQILFGQRDASVRVTNTLEAIERLSRAGYLDGERAHALSETYSFLRRLIDALRVVRGHAKDLTIPSPHTREFAYLARRLQHSSPDELQRAIATNMGFAAALWEAGLPVRG